MRQVVIPRAEHVRLAVNSRRKDEVVVGIVRQFQDRFFQDDNVRSLKEHRHESFDLLRSQSRLLLKPVIAQNPANFVENPLR